MDAVFRQQSLNGDAVYASSAPSQSADANAAITGVGALARAGVLSVVGDGAAFLPSATTQANAGTITATANAAIVNASIVLASASASAAAGLMSAAGAAAAVISGIMASARAGSMSATGDVSPDASVVLASVGAVASAGLMMAEGTRSNIGVNFTEDMVCKVVRSYLLSIAGDMRVIRTPVNLASMPDGPYVSFTPMPRRALSTDVASHQGNARLVQRSDQMTFQVDCFGEGSADLAEAINILFRDQYAIDKFAESGLPISPLYANDVMQMPFVNDANQYEERYTQEIVLQFNPLVSLTQQSANILNIASISAIRQ